MHFACMAVWWLPTKGCCCCRRHLLHTGVKLLVVCGDSMHSVQLNKLVCMILHRVKPAGVYVLSCGCKFAVCAVYQGFQTVTRCPGALCTFPPSSTGRAFPPSGCVVSKALAQVAASIAARECRRVYKRTRLDIEHSDKFDVTGIGNRTPTSEQNNSAGNVLSPESYERADLVCLHSQLQLRGR